MGLDWNPGPRAKPGFETEFETLWGKIVPHKWCWNRAAKIRRFKEITQPAFDTLKTPTVGLDEEATAWAHRQFEKRADKTLTEDQFVSRMAGFRVLSLTPPCDGLPRYSNGCPGGYVEAYAFRGQFLKGCGEIAGDELVDGAWKSKRPAETTAYGHALLKCASDYARLHHINLDAANDAEDPDSTEARLDVLRAAGRWCVFWGERGHWLEAWF